MTNVVTNVLEDALHVVLDVLTGRKPHLPQGEADKIHEAITPGYNDQPLSDAEKAQLADLEARQARQAAAAEAEAAPPVAPTEAG